MPTKHPARFSKALLPTIVEWVGDRNPVLDPLAGVGTLKTVLPGCYLNEIEPEWATECKQTFPSMINRVTLADARSLPYRSNVFASVVTSPVYGNRMSDHHEAKDLSRRNTYTHVLGRPLHEYNTGKMQWGNGRAGDEYRWFHLSIWQEVHRVLQPGGQFILNCADHIRKGERQYVTAWHSNTIRALGFEIVQAEKITTPKQRFGENGALRTDGEFLFEFRKV